MTRALETSLGDPVVTANSIEPEETLATQQFASLD